MLSEREEFSAPVKFFVGHGIIKVWPESMESQVFLKSRHKFRMDSFIRKTLFQRARNANLSGTFRHFTLRHLSIINLPASGEPLVLAGSTSSDPVKSQQLRTCRNLSCQSGPAPETSLASIRTV